MPKVGDKDFPYTPKGIQAAAKESSESGIPVQDAGSRAESYQLGGKIPGDVGFGEKPLPSPGRMPGTAGYNYEKGGKVGHRYSGNIPGKKSVYETSEAKRQAIKKSAAAALKKRAAAKKVKQSARAEKKYERKVEREKTSLKRKSKRQARKAKGIAASKAVLAAKRKERAKPYKVHPISGHRTKI